MAPFDPYHKWLGIPAEEQPASYYRLLGIANFEMDADVIEGAAEQRTIYLRTFQTGPNAELAERLLNEVSAARVSLLDGKSKARYDTQLKASQQPAQPVAEETVPEESPLPLVTPQRSVASKRPSTRTQSRRRPAVKPLWQQPWVMATASAVAVVLLLIVFNSGGDDRKPADNPKGTTTAKVDQKPKVKVPNKKTEEEQQAELERLAAEKAAAEEAAAKAGADMAESYRSQGHKYYTEKKYDLAISEYTKAIFFNPRDADAHRDRGTTFYHKGDYQTAIVDYTEAIRIKPDYAKAYYYRGIAYNKKGEPDKAIADYTEAIRISPDYADAYHRRGYVYREKGEYNKAIADYTDAIRIKPDDADAYYNRGSSHYRKTEWDKAIADYTEAISRGNLSNNALPEIYYWRGVAYEQVGDQTKAFYDKVKAKELGFKP